MEEKIQWIWTGLGAIMAVWGGVLKLIEVFGQAGAFEFVFFRGADYILLIAGLALVILSLGHDLLFGAQPDTDSLKWGFEMSGSPEKKNSGP